MKRGVLLTLLVGLIAIGYLSAQDKRLPLRLWVFRMPGTELGLDLTPMNDDDLTDLVIAHMRSPTSDGLDRQVSVYTQSAEKGTRWNTEPYLREGVPRDACAFLAGDFDPAPGGEILYLCPSRLVITRGRLGAIEIPIECFFDYPENAGLPVWKQAWDLDGDGLPEVVVPTRTGYTVFKRSGPDKRLGPVADLAVEVKLKFGPAFETALLNRFLSATSRLRRIVAVDMNADGRLDLVVYRKKGLAQFLQTAEGTFGEKPDVEDPLQLVAKTKDSEKKGDDSEAFANVRLALDDFNGDGRPDLLATRTLGEVGVFETLRTQQLIFLGREAGGWDEGKPDVVLNFKGISDDPVLIDWDADGKRDLIMSSYRMDMFTNMKRAITDSMTITYMIFRQGGDGELLPSEPSFVLDVEVSLKALEKKGGVRAVMFTADLNGDGLRDMVARRSDGGLQAVLGLLDDGDVGFDEDHPIRLAVGSTNPPWVADLDGDGRDELILEPYGGDDVAARTVRVVGVAK